VVSRVRNAKVIGSQRRCGLIEGHSTDVGLWACGAEGESGKTGDARGNGVL